MSKKEIKRAKAPNKSKTPLDLVVPNLSVKPSRLERGHKRRWKKVLQ